MFPPAPGSLGRSALISCLFMLSVSIYLGAARISRGNAPDVLLSMQIPELKKRLESEKPERCAWRDGADVCRTRGDLDTILHRHSQWLRSNGKSGDRANLTDAKLGSIDLDSADLRNAKLFHADLSGAYLEYAMLGGADLSGANLTGTHVYGASLSASHLEYAILTRADLVRANLTGAHLYHADLTNVRLFVADLTNAEMAGVRLERGDLERAKLHGVQLVDANLRNANLTRADLTGADLTHSNLSGAILVDTDLRDSGMDGARLSSALFEPEWNPPARSIASAEGLQFLTFKDKPDALVQLRKQFADGGFRTQERRITYALNRAEAELGAPSERHLKKVAFDLTCQYGMSPTRPLLILASLWFVMAFVYVTFMHLPGSSGIYRVRKREGKNRVVTLTAQIYVRPVVLKRSSKKLRQLLRLVRREWHLFRAAMFFSLMSASNIGFHEIDFGRWLRMLLKREYDLKAVGWARTVSGFQSLVSVYLLALWILTYFGRPFG